jgi:MFS family permease
MASSVRSNSTPRHRPTLFTPAFTILSVASLAYFSAAGMLLPALPRFVHDALGGGDAAVGVTFGAFGITAVLLRPPAGLLGDRRGRRPLMIAGAVVAAVAVGAYGLATTPATLALLRLLTGAGEAFFFVGMATTFVDLAPAERRGEAMSLASLALYLGIGIGPLLAEATMARLGITAVWVVAAALTLLAAALAVRVPETRPEAPAEAARRTRPRLVHPAGLLPGVILFTSIVGMAGFLAFVPLHVLDLGMGGSGAILALFAAIVVGVRSVGARLPDLLGPRRAIRTALTLSVLGLATVGTWTVPVGLATGTALLGVGIALLTPSVFALAVADVPADERAQVLGTTTAFIDIAFGAGPIAMGLIAMTFGRAAVFLAGALFALAGLAVMSMARIGPPSAVAHVLRQPAASSH